MISAIVMILTKNTDNSSGDGDDDILCSCKFKHLPTNPRCSSPNIMKYHFHKTSLLSPFTIWTLGVKKMKSKKSTRPKIGKKKSYSNST